MLSVWASLEFCHMVKSNMEEVKIGKPCQGLKCLKMTN